MILRYNLSNEIKMRGLSNEIKKIKHIGHLENKAPF